ncbi:MAG: NUDIX hydrolase [Bosea sp.]|nr:NUDIX hydrolase [Bosea sp. (in: a-proteobacteria)]
MQQTLKPAQAEPTDAVGAMHQVGALPLRRGAAGLEVCLVTTRETRRWTIPKGWPMKSKTDRQAAAIEARQEGGLVGKVGKAPIGSFLYWKRRTAQLDLVEVAVYEMRVKEQLPTWKEAGQRYVMWFPVEAAAELVEEPGLKSILASLRPAR